MKYTSLLLGKRHEYERGKVNREVREKEGGEEKREERKKAYIIPVLMTPGFSKDISSHLA